MKNQSREQFLIKDTVLYIKFDMINQICSAIKCDIRCKKEMCKIISVNMTVSKTY